MLCPARSLAHKENRQPVFSHLLCGSCPSSGIPHAFAGRFTLILSIGTLQYCKLQQMLTLLRAYCMIIQYLTSKRQSEKAARKIESQ